MTTYVIGDLQGCYDELQNLLNHINYQPEQDFLWFVGDLVNRGPKSLETLRFVKQLGKHAVTVLGNHDLHLLAIDAGYSKPPKEGDTLTPVLTAPDKEELLEWLRHRPLLHVEASQNIAMLHAGLPPQWDITQAQQHATEVETALRGKKWRKFFKHMYGNQPDQWNEKLESWDRLRFIVNCFTRMRYCTIKGKIDFREKGKPGTQPAKLLPWFEVPGRKSQDIRIVFGHWSTLGLRQTENICAIDTGCLWGGSLTALQLNGKMKTTSIPCAAQRIPG